MFPAEETPVITTIEPHLKSALALLDKGVNLAHVCAMAAITNLNDQSGRNDHALCVTLGYLAKDLDNVWSDINSSVDHIEDVRKGEA